MSHELPPLWSIKRWLFSTNHKDIGVLYLVTSLYFFFAGGVLALLMRTQLFMAENVVLGAGAYNQAVTMHGLIMVLWFLSPFAFGFANYLVPIQIGAKDMAFPRINALSYWFYLVSGIMALSSFFFGSAPDGGWTLYAPLTSSTYSPAIGFNIAAMALLLFVGSITMGTINFIVTIFRMRAPGMKLKHMPMFTWSIFITVGMMLYAFPSLLAGILILLADRTLGTMFFSSIEGGSFLWDHIFWFFGHPEVYIVLFPTLGIICDIIPTFTRRPLYGKKFIVGAMIVAAIVSFIVWGHHMFITGMNPDIIKLFTVSTIAVSLPFDVIVIAVIESLVRSKIKLKAPALFALGAIALFVIGGITGVFNASVALDYHLRGTYWVVSHFHYIMVGTSLIGLMGGLYYWFPKITGRLYNEKIARLHFYISFIGINLLYFPMFALYDMPRRISTYSVESGWQSLNSLATIGAFVFGLAQLLLIYNLVSSMRNGASSGSDPWRGSSLEWATDSPPSAHNFHKMPTVSSSGEVKFVNYEAESDGVAETHLSYWPIIVAFAAFVFLFGVVTSWIILQFGVGLGIIGIYLYARENFVAKEPKSEKWPFEKVNNMKLGVWIFLASEIIFFSALLGAYIFVRANSASWPAPGEFLSLQHGAINTFILLTSSFTAIVALMFAKTNSRRGVVASLLLTLTLGIVFIINKMSEWFELFEHGFVFSSGLPASSYFLITGVHGGHVLIGLFIVIFLLLRTSGKKPVREHSAGIEYFGLYWHFVDIVWVFLFPLFYLI